MKKLKEVKILDEKPPIYDAACNAFQVSLHTVFTYGDTIFNPHKLNLSLDVIEHEKVHMKQQNNNDTDAALWWGRYLRDPKFRIDQEARAYGRQFAFLAGRTKDRERRYIILHDLARFLSSKLYDSAIGQNEAQILIKSYAKL